MQKLALVMIAALSAAALAAEGIAAAQTPPAEAKAPTMQELIAKLGGEVYALPPSVDGGLLVNPVWAQRPTLRELLEARTALTSDEEIDVECSSGPRGQISDCKIVDQRPAGIDFSRSLRAIVGRYRLDAQPGLEGARYERVRFKVDWPLLYIDKPEWADAPTFDEVKRVYESRPDKAEERGFASVACTVMRGGRLDCQEPTQGGGEGFAALALELAKSYRMPARTSTGLPTEGARLGIRHSFPVVVPEGQGRSAYVAPKAVTTSPDWLVQATPEDLNAVYPPLARAISRSGRAVITCVVNADGRLSQCQVTRETPENFGFGQAAIRLSTKFRMRPATMDGVPYGGAKVSVPVDFSIADD